MSTEEHIAQLTAQIAALQAQLAHCSQSPPPPQPSAPPPPPKPPKVSAPSPFSGAQDDLDCFKAECSLYLSMRQSKVPRKVQQCPIHPVVHEGRIHRPLGHTENQLHPLPSQYGRGDMGRVHIGT